MESESTTPRWYLIHCKPRQDARALENLERQAFECYRPVRQLERLCDGRKFLAQEPLFPGYLFIRLDAVNANWYPIRSTRGVHQIVRFQEYPVPVHDEIIDSIRVRLAEGSARAPCLKPGESVRITQGPFSQLEAIFGAADGAERVVLLLNILQSDQRLTFPPEQYPQSGVKVSALKTLLFIRPGGYDSLRGG